MVGGGGYPGQVWMVGGGVPRPVLDGGGGTPARSRWWGVPPGHLPPRPGLDGGGYPGVPLHHDLMGYPPPRLDGVPPTITGWGTPPPPA